MTGYSITVSGVQAPAGAPGYYAGTFVSQDTYARGNPSDLWCFLPKVVGGQRESLCLLRNQPGVAAIAPTRMNPWLWTEFAPTTGTFDYVRAPVFEHRAVQIPGDLVIEYRFGGWNREGARIEVWANGRKADDYVVPRSGSGAARLRTVAGDYDIETAADGASARIAPI